MGRRGKDREPSFGLSGLDGLFRGAATRAGITNPKAIKDFVKYANADAAVSGWKSASTAAISSEELDEIARDWWSKNQPNYQ